MKFALALLIFSSVIVSKAHAALESVTLTSQDNFPAPRWMYGIGTLKAKATDKDPALILARVKQAQVEGDFAQCVDRARAARPKAKSLQGWLSVLELECAVKEKPSLKAGLDLAKGIDEVTALPETFVLGAHVQRLKTAYASALLTLIDQDLKTNRARAWKSIERVDEFSNIIDEKSKAQAWRAAGDLATAQNKPDAAKDYYKRSLALSPDGDTRDRLSAIERALGTSAAGKKASSSSPTPTPIDGVTEATPEELDLADRATQAFKSGDVTVAVELAIQIIQKFPGGSRAKWATDRVNETIASFAEKIDIKYQDVHDQVIDRVQKADGDRLTEWARLCYNRGQFAEALILSRRAVGGVDGVRRVKTLELVAESAVANEAWSEARVALQELIDKAAGQPQAREALFRLGLLNYREGKYNDAITNFERLLALSSSRKFRTGCALLVVASTSKNESGARFACSR